MARRVLKFSCLSDRDRKKCVPLPKLTEGGRVELRRTSMPNGCATCCKYTGHPILAFRGDVPSMKAVLPDADVTDNQSLIPALLLPDPDDRHVLAAAILGKASLILTSNLKDFPAADLRQYGVTSISPDDFQIRLYAVAPEALVASIQRARQNLRKTVLSP